MGLLDDLKREADQAREAKDAEAARQAALESVYRAEIAPRLLNIHRYLTEMIENLEVAEWTIDASYEIPGLGRIDNLRQSDYRVFIDGHGTPRKVTLECECGLLEQRKFTVLVAKADEFRQFLIAHQVPFTEWPAREILGGGYHSLLFQARLRVKMGLTFEADIETSRIRVTSYNFEGLTVREYPIGYAQVDSAWMDELGYYLLRKKTVLGGLEISEEARRYLRQRAEEERAQRRLDAGEIHIATANNTLDQEKAPTSLWRGLRERFFKSGRD